MGKSNAAYLEVKKSQLSGHWYWHAKAANHEIIAQSEGYVHRTDAIEAASKAFPGIEVKETFPHA